MANKKVIKQSPGGGIPPLALGLVGHFLQGFNGSSGTTKKVIKKKK